MAIAAPPGAKLKRAGDANDDVVDAGDDPVAVLGRADGDGGVAAGQLPRPVVDRFADQFLADVGEEPGLAFFRALGDVDGAQPQHVGFVDPFDRHLVFGDRQVFRPFRADLDQLRLFLAREDEELVLGPGPGPQLEPEEGLALEVLGGAAEQALGGGDLEVASQHRGAERAGGGFLAERDPHRPVGAGAGAVGAGELDQLAALGQRLQAVAVDPDHRPAGDGADEQARGKRGEERG